LRPIFPTAICYTLQYVYPYSREFAGSGRCGRYEGRREKTALTRRRSRSRPPEPLAAAQPAWYRIDLHLHTPGSGDYQEPRAGYLELLQRAEARGLDIVAFTDHNSVAGYAAMEREIDHLEFLESSARLLAEEARRLQEYRRLRDRILVLPAFEFTATFGFHILGIFPPETTVRKLEHLLLELNIPEEKLDHGASEVGATTDVLRAYEIIADAGGLVIGAHVNSTHGVAMIGLGFGGQTKIAYTQDPNLHALEVTDLESVSRRATSRFFNGSKPEYPRRMHCIQGSDAHRMVRDPQRPEKNLGIGERCTEVFLPQADFAALQALFASTDFGRTRPARAPEEHPFDPLTGAREEGATIVQAFQDGLGPPEARVDGILKDIVAFANTNGGVIYVGASADPRDPIRGVEGASELTELLRGEAARQIVPPLAPDVESLQSDDKTVLVVTVPKGTETPYALEPGYIYVRQEGETTLALRDEIVQLVRAAMAPATVGLDLPSTLPPRPRLATRPLTPVVMPGDEPQRMAEEETSAPAEPPPPVPASAPALHFAQQVAVQQATAAEQERQQERTPVPRTGVEIIASIERNGLIYHTVRDLRNRRVVRNVTRESARRLWRYAILQAEQHPVDLGDVRWDAPDGRFGFWKGYRQPEGMRRYNLIYRESAGQRNNGPNGTEGGERLRVFYGVTEEGIDERWRAVLPPDSELTDIYYDEATLPGDSPQEDAAPAEPVVIGEGEAVGDESLPAVPMPLAFQSVPASVDSESVSGVVTSPAAPPPDTTPSTEVALASPVDDFAPPADAVPPAAFAPPIPGAPFSLSFVPLPMPPIGDAVTRPTEGAVPAALLPETEAVVTPQEGPAETPEARPTPRRRNRGRGGRRGGRGAVSEGEAVSSPDDAPAGDAAPDASNAAAATLEPIAVEAPMATEEPPAAPKRRRAPRRAKAAPDEAAAAPTTAPDLSPPVPEFSVAAPVRAVDTEAQIPSEIAPVSPPRRRRAPRKPAAPPTETDTRES